MRGCIRLRSDMGIAPRLSEVVMLRLRPWASAASYGPTRSPSALLAKRLQGGMRIVPSRSHSWRRRPDRVLRRGHGVVVDLEMAGAAQYRVGPVGGRVGD